MRDVAASALFAIPDARHYDVNGAH